MLSGESNDISGQLNKIDGTNNRIVGGTNLVSGRGNAVGSRGNASASDKDFFDDSSFWGAKSSTLIIQDLKARKGGIYGKAARSGSSTPTGGSDNDSLHLQYTIINI